MHDMFDIRRQRFLLFVGEIEIIPASENDRHLQIQQFDIDELRRVHEMGNRHSESSSGSQHGGREKRATSGCSRSSYEQ